MRSYITTTFAMAGALVLSLTLSKAVAVGVQPAFRVEQAAYQLTDDQAGLGQSLLDFVSSWLTPTNKNPVRTARSADEKELFQERIHEVQPHNTAAVASIHKGFPMNLAHRRGRSKDAQSKLVSGWVLVHGLGNHTNIVQQPQLTKLTRAVRDSVADALDTCRHSVTITEARSINVKLLEESLHVAQSSSLLDRTRTGVDWLFGRRQATRSSQVNLTQVKIWYEVRVFDEMKATQDDMAARVDALQIYGRFADAGKTLSQAFIRTNVDFGPIIVLDDLGYASRDQLFRPPLSKDALLDCTEEMLLRDARVFHQYAVAGALLVAAFTACAGSAVFSIKQHSHIPSRFNMLSRDAGTVN